MSGRDWDLPTDLKNAMFDVPVLYAMHRPDGIGETVYALLYRYKQALIPEDATDARRALALQEMMKDVDDAVEAFRQHYLTGEAKDETLDPEIPF